MRYIIVPVHHYNHNNGISIPAPEPFFRLGGYTVSSIVDIRVRGCKVRFKLYMKRRNRNRNRNGPTNRRVGEVIAFRMAMCSDYLVNIRTGDGLSADRALQK